MIVKESTSSNEHALSRKREREGKEHELSRKRLHESEYTVHCLGNCRGSSERDQIHKFVKRIKLDCGSKPQICGDGKSLLRYYSNFRRTDIPKRVMFYDNGDWKDYPDEILDKIVKDLEAKKAVAVTEVDSNGRRFLLDFLLMTQLDLVTGLQTPIAWIDVGGKCFFPEIHHHDGGESVCCHQKCGKHLDCSGCHEIKLKLEIDVTEVNQPKPTSKFFDDSRGVSKKYIMAEQLTNEQYKEGFGDRCNLKFDGKLEEDNQLETNINSLVKLAEKDLDCNAVRNIFLSGAAALGNTEVLEVYRLSSNLMQDRLELFNKQIEIVKKHRGNANVRYAWIPFKKELLSRTMRYGLGHCAAFVQKSTYGIGLHLAAGRYFSPTAKRFDVAENGERYMVYCRVIMGNMEPLQRGTGQFCPSSVEYDNGVDDPVNPRVYLVWNMNMNTHVYPEFVVSFKLSSTYAEGVCNEERNGLRRLDSKAYALGPGNPKTSPRRSSDDGSSVDSATSKPRSPFMMLPMFIDIISKRVSKEDMELINAEYRLVQATKMNRREFVGKLRTIVGDDLLKEIILTQGQRVANAKPDSA